VPNRGPIRNLFPSQTGSPLSGETDGLAFAPPTVLDVALVGAVRTRTRAGGHLRDLRRVDVLGAAPFLGAAHP